MINEKFIFTNTRGQSIEFGNDAPFTLLNHEGTGGIQADIQMQKSPGQDGETYIDSTLSTRPITLTILIRASNQRELYQYRSKLSQIMSSKLPDGLLRYEYGSGAREIYAKVEQSPVFPSGNDNRGDTYQVSMIHLICPNPYWLEEEKVDQLVVWDGGIEFPLELPTFFAELSANNSKKILNSGDEETPVEIVFNGPATAPIRISNITTGDHIQVRQSLLAGERLEIDTAFGKKKVKKILVDGTEANAFHYITLDSNFFGLTVGNNLIDYSTGKDYESAGVTIKWRNRFLGV